MMKQNGLCAVCHSSQMEKIFEWPDFPLTGIYVERPSQEVYPNFDLVFLLCRECGHGQLMNAIDPHYLYVETYSHRSSASSIATQGNDFFVGFLEQFTAGRRFEAVLEVGCNDLYLLKKIKPAAKKLFGIDPIWKEKLCPNDSQIMVIGKFIEDVDFREDVSVAPDLILSAHTFEHLADPFKPIQALLDFAAPNALVVIEVPGFDSLLRTSRFDQIFHQHIQYFSVASLLRLIEKVGGRYLGHTFNYQYWNGTLLMAFCKKNADYPQVVVPKLEKPDAERIRRSYKLFQDRLSSVSDLISTLEKPIFGYGAAQMVPTLAYHLKSDLDFLECIWDDNPDKNGLYYPHLAPPIRLKTDKNHWADVSIVLTALDSARPLLSRLMSQPVKHIINPLQCF